MLSALSVYTMMIQDAQNDDNWMKVLSEKDSGTWEDRKFPIVAIATHDLVVDLQC
jgi:hypothetical protein